MTLSFTPKVAPCHVAVLMGGWSSEREVSLVSGAGVCKALAELGHNVTAIDVQRDLGSLMRVLAPATGGKPDIVFNALHGRGGEDGTVQGVLEFLGVPYTHSGVLSSALAMDKPLTKLVVEAAGVRCAKGRLISKDELLKGDPLPRPYVIKPANEGSSVGVHIVRQGDNRTPITPDGWVYGEHALVEEYIPGRELTVGLMAGRALAVTEIVFSTEFFDYTAKYTEGHARHVLPAQLPPAVTEAALRMAETAFAALQCRGIARVDFRYDERLGADGLYFLELNSQPGFTPLSLVPEQAAHIGISYAALVDWLLAHPTCPG